VAAVPIIAGTLGMVSHGNGPALSHTVAGLLGACLYQLLFVGVFLGVAWLFSRASKDDLLLRWRPGYWVVPLGALYSIAIRFVFYIAACVLVIVMLLCTHVTMTQIQTFFIDHRPRIEKLLDLQAMTDNPVYFWLNVTLVSFVIGGLREELWRSSFLAGLCALWPRTFGSRNGGILGAGVAALLFGFAHTSQGWLLAAMVTVLGFFLGVIMNVHRSVWPSVLAHGFFDAASMAGIWALHHFPELQQLQHGGG